MSEKTPLKNESLIDPDDQIEDDYPIPDKQSRTSQFVCNAFKVAVIVTVFVLFIVAVVVAIALVNHYHYKHRKLNLNIHLKLSKECANQAHAYNLIIDKYDRNQMIDFKKKFEPHITLFLTVFESYDALPEIEQRVIQAVKNMSANCQILIGNHIAASGTYTMWDVTVTQCLQQMSDLVVVATSDYVAKEAKVRVPAWVESLPPAVRDIKIDMIHKYGSPNVFSQFQPHVTLAYDDKTPDVMKKAVQQHINATSCTYTAFQIGLGSTGPYGTVKRGMDVFDISLDKASDSDNNNNNRWFTEFE